MKKFLSIALVACASLTAFGWGQKGHDTTTCIAERHLTKAAADSVASLFDGRSAIYWANWLDNASHTPKYEYTKTWHYKNIDDGVEYEEAPILETGEIVGAIRWQIATLTDANASRDERVLALKILVHLLGDIHQPMHMGHATDLGGNRVKVRFFGQSKNLHGIWDTNLLNSAHAWSYTEWADQLDRLSAEDEAKVVAGGIDDWGKETYMVASQIYVETPEDTNLGYDEVARWAPVIEEQLLRGGLRMARVLNAIFDPEVNDDPTKF